MDFFAEIDHISIKIRICGKQSKFNVITKFGGKSPHQFWEITKNRCLGPGRFWMHVCHLVPITSDHDFVKLWKTFSTKICMPLKPDIFPGGPQFYSNRMARFRAIFLQKFEQWEILDKSTATWVSDAPRTQSLRTNHDFVKLWQTFSTKI